MKALRLIGDVDREQHLTAQVPETLPPGPVGVIVLSPGETPPDQWMRAIAEEWADDLADARQDLYTLEDGQPIDGVR